jgi:hypothetical protein
MPVSMKALSHRAERNYLRISCKMRLFEIFLGHKKAPAAKPAEAY